MKVGKNVVRFHIPILIAAIALLIPSAIGMARTRIMSNGTNGLHRIVRRSGGLQEYRHHGSSFTLGKDLGVVMAKGVVLGVIGCVTTLPALILVLDRALEFPPAAGPPKALSSNKKSPPGNNWFPYSRELPCRC